MPNFNIFPKFEENKTLKGILTFIASTGAATTAFAWLFGATQNAALYIGGGLVISTVYLSFMFTLRELYRENSKLAGEKSDLLQTMSNARTAYEVERQDLNKKIQDHCYMAEALHDINDCYRDSLHSYYQSMYPNADKDKVANWQREVLNGVCQYVAGIFNRLTGLKCTVTVHFIVKEKEHPGFAFAFACNNANWVEMQGKNRQTYTLLPGKNTAYEKALSPKTFPDVTCCFFSNDLDADRRNHRYEDELTGWQSLYQSRITVAIRYYDHNHTLRDELGFLTVHTEEKNALNNGYYVELVAAFADQMFNFISLSQNIYENLHKRVPTGHTPSFHLTLPSHAPNMTGEILSSDKPKKDA